MSQRSFNDSFLERLEKLCQKYEAIEDEADDTIDLLDMEIVTDNGRTREMPRVEMGTLYECTYKRVTAPFRQRAWLTSGVDFERLYGCVFSCEFDVLYDFYVSGHNFNNI